MRVGVVPLLTGVLPTAPRRNADPLSVMLVRRNAIVIGVMPKAQGVMPNR